MSRLEEWKSAPWFKMRSFQGDDINLDAYRGRYVLLSFYRYASCPFCNLRVHESIQKNDYFRSLGLEMIAVFQSPDDKLAEYVGKQPLNYPIIGDPDLQLYRLYRVETSWIGLLKAFLFRPHKILTSVFLRGFFPGSIENEIQRLPADFLINPQGKIEIAYYGKDIGDHIAYETIENVLRNDIIES
ncbi:MAG: redoxin domain-containing protein [Sulfuricurvum sp.]|uniref:peroxiredoxin family protein n=1 Tax=Sulfuricurvum sp. TaxID=2025608 RepID=UPI0026191181|nr:redoxin domain-containing protein [Sulfuricurvum sp.]MDD2951291.1 redoxin domain-containing protein [Sulfuricurvum sp.]MDD5117854.1 redoxin domain-containing protein [Sulfuricurvum sp.]